MLRSDYGSTWHGNLTIRNCTVDDSCGVPIKALVTARWVPHYFGYECHAPNITVENLKFVNPPEKLSVMRIGNIDKPGENITKKVFSDGTENINPYFVPEYVKVINDTTNVKYTLNGDGAFEATETEGIFEKN
jgi:hypothetical protein